MALFRLQYTGKDATEPLEDDASLTREQKWQLLFDRNWNNLADSSQTKWLVYLRKWQKWIDDHSEHPEGARAATAEARRSDDADPSCSSTTLSAEEYAELLEAAMRYPDQQVGLCVAAMVSVSLTAGFRSDDLQDTRYFMELVATVPAEPLPMQVLAIAHNGGKANQDGQTTTATSKQTYYDMSSMLLKVIATMRNPLVKTKITHLMRCSGLADLAAAACSMDVMRVWGRWAAADGVMGKSYLPKSPLSALSATGVLAGFGADFMTNHAFGRGTVAVPVAWIDAVAPGGRRVLQAVRVRNQSGAGKPDHSGKHAVESILYLTETFWQSSPFMLQRYGLSWWALQLPAVRVIVGSYDYRVFEQEVLQAELHWSARPLSPQLTEAFRKIKQQEATDDVAPLMMFR
ncbi:hypothetical protein WJX72_009688 [[Myrmecia] bisecta]|uniref:Uncharacterized protein n=1 Tax=[Myrmecia] bisecta TaxID=41462 RepID=A0AAW1R8H6_9CHLO